MGDPQHKLNWNAQFLLGTSVSQRSNPFCGIPRHSPKKLSHPASDMTRMEEAAPCGQKGLNDNN